MTSTIHAGNNTKPASAGQQNGVTPGGQDRARVDTERSRDILKGDLVQKHEARAEREKLRRHKQNKMALAAQEDKPVIIAVITSLWEVERGAY
ncbi:hypothetical protein ElyMa_000912200 [Elysia marginata]|uniref:IBB domain-containing protein n=1 Tax=Elysia marginata TaxID=1093978 RepID=A0AAV4H7T3_9GAST|nr:hypothetical protein ElyMa_000912200 [Elysia marginata]